MKYKHIAVEGNIGAGKTTLTKFLSSILNGSRYLKNLKKISFLKPFTKRVNLRFNLKYNSY